MKHAATEGGEHAGKLSGAGRVRGSRDGRPCRGRRHLHPGFLRHLVASLSHRMRRKSDGTGNFGQLVGDYTNPILKPQAAAIVKQHGDISLAGGGYPTPSNQCWPGGVPYVFWDFLLEMFQGPDRITMIYRHGNETRHVRLNASHPAQPVPSWYGDAVGHYEGDTLVIDTVGIKIGPYAMVDM